MNYKYKRSQLFKKRLKVPKGILSHIYRSTLSLEDYIKYDLSDKIPISCILEEDRQIVEKFGVEKAKTLDFELMQIYFRNIDIRELLMSMDASVKDLNLSLYELIKDQIETFEYTAQMKEVYKDRFFDISEDDKDYKKFSFNNGSVSLKDLVRDWNLYKDKDLSYCLKKDWGNEFNITNNQLKEFMNTYGNISRLILEYTNIYSFIHELNNLQTETEKHEFIKQFTDNILKNSYKESYDSKEPILISEDEYREIFKYSSMEEYLKIFNNAMASKVMKELKNLPSDYVFNIPIPFRTLCSEYVLNFVGNYGLKNVVDFDNECGQFFTKNNCEMLKSMYSIYMKYSIRDNSKKTIFTNSYYDENGNYVELPYTKDEFYEAIRRMVIYGPTNGDYADKAPDYRNITGEFRVRNAELFISEQAPEELQKLFYTKSITPQLLVEHPEYIQYLNGKNLETCFKIEAIQVIRSDGSYVSENLYNFLGEKTNFDGMMNFIIEYSDIFDIVFDRKMPYWYEIKFSMEDNLNEMQKRINESFKRIIIEQGISYPKTIPQNLKNNYPSMFISSEAPKELQEAFYNRTINSNFVLSNSIYRSYLKNIDLEVLYKYMPVNVVRENDRYDQVNLISAIKQTFGAENSLDVMLLYDKYIESVFEANQLQNFRYSPNFSKDDLLDELDSNILQIIIDGKMKYDESIPSHFKNNNPTLFLSQNVSQDIRNKFYNREFTLNDFNSNPNLLETFGDTNVVCGFSENVSWMIPLFNESDNLKIANFNRLKVISEYSKIQDVALQDTFKEYVMEFGNNIEIEKIEYVSEVLSRLSLSNSSEIFTFRKELATQLLKSSNPLESLSKIEDVFIRNNIPTIGKIYSCFDILHPNFQGFDFNSSTISPVLKKSSTRAKSVIIFSDLIKSAFGSNNKSINSYLKNIEIASNVYESIKSGQIKYDQLDEQQKDELNIFKRYLSTLYNNTLVGRKETFTHTDDTISDIFELSKKLSPNGLEYNLADRVISMFTHFSGIDTLEEAQNYIRDKIQTADAKNRNASNSDMKLEKGDFIKGIGDITYLRNILQNGSVSKEFLGASADSDNTPLDTDVSMITTSDGTITNKISDTAAKDYGPIWFVLKNDDRFITTRTSIETPNIKNDMSKMEVFYTGVLGEGHYGIRTGFASSEINYIVMENYDSRVGLEIALNGFYIPVANKEGKIVFTPNDYDKLREKMSGLSYFDENSYVFSDNLVTEDTDYIASQIEQSNYEVYVKKTKINEVIRKSLEQLGLHLKTTIDGDLTEGFVEIIDTGSTGRGTNKPGDGDFDFMMRLDKKILSDPTKIGELKQTLLRNLGKENSSEITDTGDFRLKGVQLDSETNVDIDRFENKFRLRASARSFLRINR